VIGSVPTGNTVVVTTAVPVAEFTEPVPRFVLPLVTVTVPVVPMGKVVVMVTELPKRLGFGVEVTAMVGVVCLTVCVRLAVAVLLFVSPL
jgi:hypothetical protein